MFNPLHSQDEEDKYGTVKRVVSSPQSTTVTNQERKAPTPCSLSSPLIGCTPLKGPDTNPALLNESALLIGSTLSDLSLLTDSSLFTDSSFLLPHSTSLGSLCSTPTEGEMYIDSWVCTNDHTFKAEYLCFRNVKVPLLCLFEYYPSCSVSCSCMWT